MDIDGTKIFKFILYILLLICIVFSCEFAVKYEFG